jgi:hypothetical protein
MVAGVGPIGWRDAIPRGNDGDYTSIREAIAGRQNTLKASESRVENVAS